MISLEGDRGEGVSDICQRSIHQQRHKRTLSATSVVASVVAVVVIVTVVTDVAVVAVAVVVG